MAVGYSAPEDVINAALREAGYPKAIAEIYEGSRASRVAVEIYGPARDFLLQQQDWDFALRETTLVATVGGALILGFTNEYNFPSDALRVCSVHGVIPSPNNDPQPVRWISGNDGTLATPARVIFTNQTSAKAVYIAQITNPATWNAAFTRAFVSLLARIFTDALKDDINQSRIRSQVSDQTTALAADVGDGIAPMVPELMMRASAAAARQ